MRALLAVCLSVLASIAADPPPKELPEGRVLATKEPFVQPIYDLSVPRMVFGRVCLLGDAAFVPRPHTAASTSKAVTNAITLAEAIGASQAPHRDDRDVVVSDQRGASNIGARLDGGGAKL